MKFEQVRNGRWESDTKVYSAALLTGSERELKGMEDAKYVIVAGDYKGNTAYRLYEQHLGHKEFIKRFKSVEAAIKFAQEA